MKYFSTIKRGLPDGLRNPRGQNQLSSMVRGSIMLRLCLDVWQERDQPKLFQLSLNSLATRLKTTTAFPAKNINP